MIFLKYAVIVLLSVLTLFIIIMAFKSQKPLSFILFNAFLGVVTLLIAYLTRGFSGIKISINPYTLTTSAVLGIPSLIMMLILNFIVFM